MSNSFFIVDVEARGTSPVNGIMTEFGAVHFKTRDTFHGVIWDAYPDPLNPSIPVPDVQLRTDKEVGSDFAMWVIKHCPKGRPIFISDNPAFDFMWIAGMFDKADIANPFGFSGRRIGDFWAGVHLDYSKTQDWKKFRKTVHDHNPVNDALGNAEALEEIFRIVARMQGDES